MVTIPEMKRAEDLGAIIRAFRLEPLNKDELARFYCDNTMAVRTGDQWVSPLDDLFEDCTVPHENNAHLLLGHRGCGKSTELFNLKRRFEKEGQPVIIINALLEIDLNHIDCWEIMLLITEGLCRIAEDKDISLPGKTVEEVYDSLKEIEQTTSSDNESAIDVSGGAEAKTPGLLQLFNLFVSVKSSIKTSTKKSKEIKETIERSAADWIASIREISDRISAGCGYQPIIIFEDIDKIPLPQKAIEIFRYSVLAQMPFPIIYTFPISQFYAPGFASIRDLYKYHTLPMIKVSNLDKSENLEGIDILREIVGLRADMGLFEHSDKNDVLKTLIKQTGGSLRDLFICITTAARRANRRGVEMIEMEDAERALSELSSELTRRISKDDYGMLSNIYENEKSREQIVNTDFLLRHMEAMVVFEYNGRRWHDLHPLIAEFLKDQGEIK